MVNVDASVFQEANLMGLGNVLRNHRGYFLAACRKGINKITNPELAKAFAFRNAVLFKALIQSSHYCK